MGPGNTLVICRSCRATLLVCECCGAFTDSGYNETARGTFCRRCGFLNLTGRERQAFSPLSMYPVDDIVQVCMIFAVFMSH